jgi:hypothetical protein
MKQIFKDLGKLIKELNNAKKHLTGKKLAEIQMNVAFLM